MVLHIPLAVAGKERVTRMAYSHAQGRLHAIRPDSPGVREAAAAVKRYPEPMAHGPEACEPSHPCGSR